MKQFIKEAMHIRFIVIQKLLVARLFFISLLLFKKYFIYGWKHDWDLRICIMKILLEVALWKYISDRNFD